MREQPDLITAAELAEEFGLAAGTLSNWRSQRTGPPYVKLNGRVVRYSRKACARWLAAQQMGAA